MLLLSELKTADLLSLVSVRGLFAPMRRTCPQAIEGDPVTRLALREASGGVNLLARNSNRSIIHMVVIFIVF
jgi:hypothetical protein